MTVPGQGFGSKEKMLKNLCNMKTISELIKATRNLQERVQNLEERLKIQVEINQVLIDLLRADKPIIVDAIEETKTEN